MSASLFLPLKQFHQCHFSRFLYDTIQYLVFSFSLHFIEQALRSYTSVKLTQICSLLQLIFHCTHVPQLFILSLICWSTGGLLEEQLIQLSIRRTNNWIKKWTQDLNRCLSKENIKMANKHIKDAQHCALSLEKPKLQWDITLHHSEWPPSKKL